MRRMLALAVLAVGLLAGQASAAGPGYGYGYGSTGFGFRVRLFGGVSPGCYGGVGPGVQLGPWYQYWPYEAHFQAPALPQYPYWPAPQTLPPGQPFAGAPGYDH